MRRLRKERIMERRRRVILRARRIRRRRAIAKKELKELNTSKN